MPIRIKKVMDEIRRIGRERVVPRPHAISRERTRQIDRADWEYVLFESGKYIRGHDRYCNNRKSWSYRIEGLTIDDWVLRVVVAFEPEPLEPDSSIIVITLVEPGDENENSE